MCVHECGSVCTHYKKHEGSKKARYFFLATNVPCRTVGVIAYVIGVYIHMVHFVPMCVASLCGVYVCVLFLVVRIYFLRSNVEKRGMGKEKVKKRKKVRYASIYKKKRERVRDTYM